MSRTRMPRDAYGLSEIDVQILRLLAQEYTIREIARTLCYAEKTINSYLCLMYQKLKVRGGIGAVLWANAHGYLIHPSIVKAS